MEAAGTLKQQLVVWGIVLTWAVGGVVGVERYRQITLTVRRKAEARVEDAVRVMGFVLVRDPIVSAYPRSGEGRQKGTRLFLSLCRRFQRAGRAARQRFDVALRTTRLPSATTKRGTCQ